MYRKNVAGQFVCFQMLLTATGAVATGLTPATRRCIDGTFAAGGGTVTEDGTTGAYKYAMAQADTNGNDVSLIFTATGAMPVCVNFVTTAADPTNATSFGLTNLDAAITSRMATYTQPTGFLAATFPASVASPTNITSGTITTVTNQLTAAQIATGVWQDAVAGDFTTASSVGKSLYNAFTANTSVYTAAALVNAPTGGAAPTVAQIATAVWTDTTAGDFTTALSVGKSVMNGVALGTGLTVNAVTGLTASNLDATVSSRMATYTQPTGFLAATFPASVASPTNITAGTITTVTNLTNAPTAGDLTATMKTSVTTAATAATPIAASVTGAVGSVTGNVGGNVVGSVASVTARVTANTDQFNGDATAAANIAFTTRAIGRCTVTTSGTTTSIPTSACAPSGVAADQFKGRIITFDANTTTTALRGQSTDITASSAAATPVFTVTALTTAPVSGDTFSMT
jgi:hypothetical protein